jgi:iron complex transport system substrate-binding protein
MKKGLASVLVALSLLAAGCGTSEKDTSKALASQANVAFPVTLDSGGRHTVIDKRPQRIVSLSPTATEDLFAIDAGTQVIAADKLSNYPAEAPKTDLSGFSPNVEAVLSYKPDLVIGQMDANGLVAAMEKAGVAVLLQPSAASLDDIYKQLADLGSATDHAQEAADASNVMRQLIKDNVERVGTKGNGKTYYHEVDNTLYSSTSKTFIGSVYSLFGMSNIADAAATNANQYPQLSSEFIVKANPTFIFLADTRAGESRDNVAKRPGWANLDAVKNNHVVALSDDMASRWSPRVVELVNAIGSAANNS